MSWQKKLNVRNEEEGIISAEVDKYLKNHGFYESTLSPRFFGEETFRSSIKEPGVTCLRLDTSDPRDKEYTMRIFITEKEAYMEVQTSWRSFDRSWHMDIEEGVSMENIDEVLDEMSDS